MEELAEAMDELAESLEELAKAMEGLAEAMEEFAEELTNTKLTTRHRTHTEFGTHLFSHISQTVVASVGEVGCISRPPTKDQKPNLRNAILRTA